MVSNGSNNALPAVGAWNTKDITQQNAIPCLSCRHTIRCNMALSDGMTRKNTYIIRWLPEVVAMSLGVILEQHSPHNNSHHKPDLSTRKLHG